MFMMKFTFALMVACSSLILVTCAEISGFSLTKVHMTGPDGATFDLPTPGATRSNLDNGMPILVTSDSSDSTVSSTTSTTLSDDSSTLSSTSSDVTAAASSTSISARPEASGFWTGSDPFSFVRPSTYDSSSSTTSDQINTSAVSSLSTPTSSANNGSFATSNSSHLSTSISTQVTWVTATPVPQAGSSVNGKPVSAAEGGKIKVMDKCMDAVILILLYVFQAML